MHLSELLNRELILIKSKGTSKEELIAELVDQIYLINKDIPLQREELLKSISMREQIGGTTFPSGLSVPHSRLKNYEDIVIAIATTCSPVFHDGIQIRLVALMLSSQTGGQYYLPAVAALTKISRDKDYFSRLSDADTPDDFLSILKERDPELG